MTQSQTLTKPKIKKPKMYNVILHNDDVTPFQYVLLVLTNIFEKSETDAVEITQQIHVSKGGIAGTYSKEIAQEKINEVLTMNFEFNFNLMVSMEEE